MTTLVRSGFVCYEDRIERGDILILDARIAEAGDIVSSGADRYVEVPGAFVLPGMIDIHTHIGDRIGGYLLADDYASGTRVAVQNGITTLATFITESPSTLLEDAVAAALRSASGACYADHWWHITPTRFDAEGCHALDRLLVRGFRHLKLYTTYGNAGLYSSYDRIEELFERLAGRGVQFLVHCEDDDILAGVRLSDEEWRHPRAHARSRPPEAEVTAIGEVVRRAQRHAAAVHIVHVSTPEGLALIQAARPSGRVTCETGPQYLFLDERRLDGDEGHRWICSPPLRSSGMRQMMAAMAERGAVDLFATDHCAFTRKDKDAHRASVREIPNGLAGIGALPHLIYALFAGKDPQPMLALARRLCANPARLLGVYPRKGVIAPGADADLVVCRITTESRSVQSSLADVYETYPDARTQLLVERVFLRGEEIVRNGQLLHPEERRGRTLWPT